MRSVFVGLVILALPVSSGAAQGHGDADQVRARQKIFMMEGVLERAVQVGIDSLRRQLAAVMPDDMLLVAGDGPQARGFRLDGYGVFFDVEVPQVRPSLAWSLRTMNETAALFARDLAQMQAQLRQAVPDAQQRAELERALVRLQQQVVPQGGGVSAAGEPRATVASQMVERQVVPTTPEPAPAAVDPGEEYTKAVAEALIDAMLENSGGLIIEPGEWLTVAARDNARGNRFVPGDPSEVITLVLRVKGSDIAAFQGRRLTLEEVRKRVEVRAF